MLKKIKLDSFIIFENFSLDFQNGMTAITGTTGSGKSIIFDAIEFALGFKSTRSIKNKKSDVTLYFQHKKQELMIRHLRTNTSKFYINQAPANKTDVQEIAHELLHCQRQNQHLQSLNNSYQRHVLDQYANVNLKSINSLFAEFQAIKKTLADKSQELALIDLELGQHYLTELTQLSPSLPDWQSLHQSLNNSKQSQKNQTNTIRSQELINNVLENLNSLIKIQEENSNLAKCLEEAYVLASEAESEIDQLIRQPELSPYEIQQLEERVQEYFRLARKHKVKPEELSEIYEHYQQDCLKANNLQDAISSLESQLALIKAKWLDAAEKICYQRHEAAQKLASLLSEKLLDLHMTAKILLKFELRDDNVAPDGGGFLEFLIATKEQQPLKPVAQVISGGEAARLSLVMQEVLAKNYTDITYLMDEVDVGVSGAVASGIGLLLKRVAMNNQVFCITHTPQVAAIAEHHISMSQTDKVLNFDARVLEIAAMLSHDGVTETAKQQAHELLS